MSKSRRLTLTFFPTISAVPDYIFSFLEALLVGLWLLIEYKKIKVVVVVDTLSLTIIRFILASLELIIKPLIFSSVIDFSGLVLLSIVCSVFH